MSNVLIKDNPEAELARLASTNFFRDKPAYMSQAAYLHLIAVREAKRFGTIDYLAAHYARIAAYAQKVGA
jgi:hypothetical protein